VQITAHLVERLGGGTNYRAGSGFAKLNFAADLPSTSSVCLAPPWKQYFYRQDRESSDA